MNGNSAQQVPRPCTRAEISYLVGTETCSQSPQELADALNTLYPVVRHYFRYTKPHRQILDIKVEYYSIPQSTRDEMFTAGVTLPNLYP